MAWEKILETIIKYLSKKYCITNALETEYNTIYTYVHTHKFTCAQN